MVSGLIQIFRGLRHRGRLQSPNRPAPPAGSSGSLRQYMAPVHQRFPELVGCRVQIAQAERRAEDFSHALG